MSSKDDIRVRLFDPNGNTVILRVFYLIFPENLLQIPETY